MLHRKNLQPFTGVVFVNSLQVLDSLQENPCIYGESVSASFNMRFPGQYQDTESGMFYNGFRSLMASQGRYSQSDPIGLAGGWSRFGYVHGNSLAYTDPHGLNPIVGLVALAELVLLADSVANGPVPLPVGGRLVSGAGAAAATTTLYRAVKPEELMCINSSGMFKNLGSAEGKYFTTSATDAAFYAQQAVKGFRDPPYTIVQTVVPSSTLSGLTPAIVDRGIPAWVIPNSRLPGMTPNVLNYSPIPRR